MNEASKLAQVIREMKLYRLDILGVSECRWTGSGRQVSHDSSTILYSGHEDTHIRGVALVISKQKANTLLEWEPISDRIMKHAPTPNTASLQSFCVTPQPMNLTKGTRKTGTSSRQSATT
ncbi:hypothetical protein NP493_437g00003 [Ridgeia piscesae]|uniref:Uncharacterized protein n=1 Tax=Ridgeia piscesae TaxID=27915 RepID=A0AAD9NRX6_RIDPI|nr:hypothetical protein NP493_437g00003 [Ridgeia piscesae]